LTYLSFVRAGISNLSSSSNKQQQQQVAAAASSSSSDSFTMIYLK
jgi:hypothetical protein